MASTDARPVPRKNIAYRVTFPILDADGDLVTGATGLDSEVSIDGAAFADATSEATEIATSSGMYFLDLTTGEMNGDTVAVIVKTSSVGAKTTAIVMYPEEAGDYRADVVQIAGSTVSTSTAQLGVNVVQAAGTAWNSGAIGASTLATTAVDEIVDAVWDEVITAGAHNVTNSSAVYLRQAGGGQSIVIHSGTSPGGGGSGTFVLDTAASATDDIYNRNIVVLNGGTGVGQSRRIVDYTGSSRTAVLDQPWTTTPNATTTFQILAAPISVISDEGVAQAGAATTITLATTASTSNDIYTGSLVTVVSGTGSGQTRKITGYVGSTRVATVDATWSVTPDSTSVYAVTPADVTDVGPAAPSANENALALLRMDWTSITGEAARSVLNAMRTIRNKSSIISSTLTVTKEDDTTAAWQGTVSTSSAAQPIIGVDPT